MCECRGTCHDPRSAFAGRGAFTLIELVVSIAVIGILMALLLPAVQYCRESARRTDCKNRLRQQGLALHNFHAAHNHFPIGQDGTNDFDHSWCTAVLPYLEQAALFDQYDYTRPWYDATSQNPAVAATNLKVFLCPSTSHSFPGAMDYAGTYGSDLTGLGCCFGVGLGWDSGILVGVRIEANGQPQRQGPINMAEITDGTSHTFLVVEDAGRTEIEGGLWASGANCLAVAEPVNKNRSNEIFSDHRVGAHVLLADGSVNFLSNATDLYMLGSLATRNGGETTPVSW
jgi:prepilin-type N-terminal cleavage/methylation domain-containing protein